MRQWLVKSYSFAKFAFLLLGWNSIKCDQIVIISFVEAKSRFHKLE